MNFKLKVRKKICGDFGIVQNSLFFISKSILYQNPKNKLLELQNYMGIQYEKNLFNVFTNRS